MRWLMIVLLVSLLGLLAISAGVTIHVVREHRRRNAPRASAQKPDETETETEEAP